MEITWLLIAQVGGILFLSSILRSITGFGGALAAVPAMSLIIDPSAAVIIMSCTQIMIGTRDIPRLHNKIDRFSMKWLAVGALLGTPAGVYMLFWLDPYLARMVIAVIVCVAIPVLMVPNGLSLKVRRLTALPAGLASGFFGGLAAMPGPPAVIYFAATKVPVINTRASLLIFFNLTAVMAMPLFYFSGLIKLDYVIVAVCALPFFYFGAWVGDRIFAKTSDSLYRKLSIALLLITGLSTGLRGYLGYYDIPLPF